MAKRSKPSKKLVPAPKGQIAPGASPGELLDDLRGLIRQAREGIAQAVNSALVLLYWQVGHRIRTDILQEQRAGYGEEIVSTLSRQLSAEFGNGFSRPNLFRMVRFAEVFPDQQIISALSRQLGWSPGPTHHTSPKLRLVSRISSRNAGFRQSPVLKSPPREIP